MTQYQSNFDGAKPFSDTAYQVSLAANVEQTYTVPGDSSLRYRAKFEFSSNSNVYVGLNVTAASPAGGTDSDTANLEFRPSEPKYVKGGDVLHFVSPDAAGASAGVSLLLLP